MTNEVRADTTKVNQDLIDAVYQCEDVFERLVHTAAWRKYMRKPYSAVRKAIAGVEALNDLRADADNSKNEPIPF